MHHFVFDFALSGISLNAYVPPALWTTCICQAISSPSLHTLSRPMVECASSCPFLVPEYCKSDSMFNQHERCSENASGKISSECTPQCPKLALCAPSAAFERLRAGTRHECVRLHPGPCGQSDRGQTRRIRQRANVARHSCRKMNAHPLERRI